MRLHFMAGVCALAFAVPGNPAFAADSVEVVHHLTVNTERAAIKEIADRFTAAGGVWVDNAVAGPPNSRRVYTTRMNAGQPPQAYLTVTNLDHYDFAAQGQLVNLDSVAQAENWAKVFPPEIMETIKAPDGHIYVAPLGLNVPGYVFYNKKIFDDLGIKEPVGFDDDFFAALDKVKAAGIIPLAYSGDPFHVRFPFEAIMMSLGGKDLWDNVWRQRSNAAIRSPEMRKVFETFERLRDYTDEGSSGRAWNLSANLVMSGKAAVQIMGDWAKGEYIAAGMVPGKTLGCFIPGADDLIQIHGEVLVFPKQPGTTALTPAQAKLAAIATSADAQTAYNAQKRSFPSRLDANVAAMDPCLQLNIDAYRNPGHIVQNPRSLITQQMDGEYRDLVNEFMAEPEMTVDEVVDRFAEVLQAK
ncbi:ABC transporter substrate-binding protein [Neorhizobium petrolearium]|uniref:ABC transporter substrate-binding protein n=1 Tax=Neorhizobium petrolearium TaxID=515361 RepID=UPI003F18499C